MAHAQQKKQQQKKILMAMSGGVDSAVAAFLLKEQGHEVVGVTMKLWGGESDVGCCSVSDVDDARRVADLIGIPHFVFNFGQGFQDDVVDPYVESYQKGETPNPCIECNRKIKFDLLINRARVLGFDALATGHHARIVFDDNNQPWLARAADPQKDQSYVLHMLSEEDLRYTIFPIGEMQKDEVREVAAKNNLRVARKPDSFEVCFIKKATGREDFLKQRISLTPAKVFNSNGEELGMTPALEMLTVGQRKGVNLIPTEKNASQTAEPISPSYVLDVEPPIYKQDHYKGETYKGENADSKNITHEGVPGYVAGDAMGGHVTGNATGQATGRVTIGKIEELMVETQKIRDFSFRIDAIQAKTTENADKNKGNGQTMGKNEQNSLNKLNNSNNNSNNSNNNAKIPVLVQTSAHSTPEAAFLSFSSLDSENSANLSDEMLINDEVLINWEINWEKPQKRVAKGQSLVFYGDNSLNSQKKDAGLGSVVSGDVFLGNFVLGNVVLGSAVAN